MLTNKMVYVEFRDDLKYYLNLGVSYKLLIIVYKFRLNIIRKYCLRYIHYVLRYVHSRLLKWHRI